LNFGKPYNPESYWQFVNAVQGMGSACEAFKTPVTGGNVSFYNQTVTKDNEEPVFPTPTIGMIGLLDKSNAMSIGFKNESDNIYIVGKVVNDIASSEYLVNIYGEDKSPAPYFNLEEEQKVQSSIQHLITDKLINSAHDCADGGLIMALMESSFNSSDLGFKLDVNINTRIDSFFFGEAQGRIVVTVSPEKSEEFETKLTQKNQEYLKLGTVSKNDLEINGINLGSLENLKEIHLSALKNKIEG